jgi:uncharacterized membrane protein YgdD (TMEM256/DUF423 family)
MNTKWIWASLAIVSMWVAVLFTAVWAPSLEATSSNGDSFTIPAAVAVSLFAAIATIVVAAIGFRGDARGEKKSRARAGRRADAQPHGVSMGPPPADT